MYSWCTSGERWTPCPPFPPSWLLPLLNISCIFSVCASIFFWDLGFSLLSLLWILFWVDCLSPLHLVVLLGFHLVSSSGTRQQILFCCLILSDFPCLWSPFHRVQDHTSSCFWCLPPCGWGWSRALCRLPSERDWCLPTGGWSWACPSGGQDHVKECV